MRYVYVRKREAQAGKPVRLLHFGNVSVDSLNGLTSAEVDLVAELSKDDCRMDELVTDFLSFIESNVGKEDADAILPPEFQEELKELDEAEITNLRVAFWSS